MIIICINTVTLCYKVQIAKVITFRYNGGVPSKDTSGNKAEKSIVTLCYKVKVAIVITFSYNGGVPGKGTQKGKIKGG